MNKENLSSTDIQDTLWGKTLGQANLQKRFDQTQRGWMPRGVPLEKLSGNPEKFGKILGDFAPRVLAVTDPNNPATLLPEQIAVAGGWCALRTKDVSTLGGQGVIMNPRTGEIENVISVDQVALWVPQAVAFDQIVESIGAVNASEYAVISERKLWSERLVKKLSTILSRNLTIDEQQKIENSVEDAEKIRATLTERYLQYVTKKENVIFQRVVDDDVWNDLKRARDEMLSSASLPLIRLQSRYPKERSILPTSTMVWAMYTEPYMDMLRQKGYISKKQTFIVEPAMHATVETEPESDIAQDLFQSRGIYLDEKGTNKNTGFIAYLECVTGSKQNVRKELNIGQVPNITNWEDMFATGSTLDPDYNCTTDITRNQLYMWGMNFLPVGKVQSALVELADLSTQFSLEKKQANSQFSFKGKPDDATLNGIRDMVAAIEKRFQPLIGEQNQIISDELRNMFQYITEGLEVPDGRTNK